MSVTFEIYDARAGVEYFSPAAVWSWFLAVWLLVAIALALLLLVLPRRFRPLAGSLALTGMPLYLFGLRVLRPLPWVHPLPKIPLAVGILVTWIVVSLRLRPDQSEYRMKVRFRLAIALAALGAVGVGLWLTGLASPLNAEPLTGKLRRSGDVRPNIIVIVLDTLRFDTVQRMPNLERFESRGTVFANAFSTAPWTLPAHLSMVTGREARYVTWTHQKLDVQLPLPAILQRQGYLTAGVVANPLLNDDTGFTRGFTTYEIYSHGLDICRSAPIYFLRSYSPAFQHTVCSAGASTIVPAAQRVIAKAKQPLFLFINFTDVHDSYYVPSRCGDRTTLTALDLVEMGRAVRGDIILTPKRRARLFRVYEDSARCLDQSLGTLFKSIDALPSPTVTIILSDHGEQFGNHELYMHGNSLYPELTHIPLAVVGTGIPAATVRRAVSSSEIYDLALHVADPTRRSRLADLAAGRPAATRLPASYLLEDFTFLRVHQRVAVAYGDMYLIHRSDKVDELYNLAVDPSAQHNLAPYPAYDSLQKKLCALATNNLQHDEQNEDLQSMRSLGYIQ